MDHDEAMMKEEAIRQDKADQTIRVKEEKEDYAKDAYDVVDTLRDDTGFAEGKLFDGAYEIAKQFADLAREELERRVGGPIPHRQEPAHLPSVYPKSSAFSRVVSEDEVVGGLSQDELAKIKSGG